MLVNLTPHPMHIFGFDCPDQIEPGTVEPIRVIESSGDLARVAGDEIGQWDADDLLVIRVDYRGVVGLPPYAGHMDSRDREVWYLVSLPVALAARDRADLLVPYAHVRNMTGSVIGCRMFAQPS